MTSGYHLATVTPPSVLPIAAQGLPTSSSRVALGACVTGYGARPERPNPRATHTAMGATHRALRGLISRPGFVVFRLAENTPKAKGLEVGQNGCRSDNLRYDYLTGMGPGAALGPLLTGYGYAMGYPYWAALGRAHDCFTDRCDTGKGSPAAGPIRSGKNPVATHHTPHTTDTQVPAHALCGTVPAQQETA